MHVFLLCMPHFDDRGESNMLSPWLKAHKRVIGDIVACRPLGALNCRRGHSNAGVRIKQGIMA